LGLQGVVTWEEFVAFHFSVQSNLPDIKLAFELTGAAEITEGEAALVKSTVG
jgi:hypothetical protein